MRISSGASKAVASMLTALFALVCISASQAAETKTVKFTNKWGPVLQRMTLPVGAQPGHDLALQVRQDASASSYPDWDGSTNLVTGQADLVKGSGPVWGYVTRTHKNGDKSYYRYEGDITRTGEGAQWESIGKGTVKALGGTGKFAKIKGAGAFNSKSSPEGGSSEAVLNVEY